MKELLTEVNASILMEYNRAAEKFGPAFHSHHESFAIILEELEEAQDALDCFRERLAEYWRGVKHNSEKESLDLSLALMRLNAASAAAEMIQVAAMCDKAGKD